MHGAMESFTRQAAEVAMADRPEAANTPGFFLGKEFSFEPMSGAMRSDEFGFDSGQGPATVSWHRASLLVVIGAGQMFIEPFRGPRVTDTPKEFGAGGRGNEGFHRIPRIVVTRDGAPMDEVF